MATQTSTLQQRNLFTGRPSTTSTPPAATPPKPTERTRPYKDFLTPSLHRRFSQAAALVFIGCYLQALLISPPKLLWILNPISFHGARALTLFVSCLMVFIIRVANLRFGRRLTASGAETLYQTLTSTSTLNTAVWYVMSAFLFGEVYLWSRDASANLGWIDHGRWNERSRVNENPLFLRAVWFCIALGQTAMHLGREEDAVAVPLNKQTDAQAATTKAASRVPAAVYELQGRAFGMLRRSLVLALPGFAASVILYFTILRRLMWPFFHSMAQVFYSDLATESQAEGLQINRIFQLTWQSFSSALMLAMLWELSNAAFSIYMAEPPTKKDEPLTSEIKDNTGAIIVKSKDPNGSLISGLKSKKEVSKAFAMWELAVICARFPARRKTIYTEVDRKDGSTWKQISKDCLGELSALSTRIKIALDPEKAQKEHDEKLLQQQREQGLIAANPEQPLGLPKIANKGVAQYGDIYQKQRPDLAQSVGNVVKSFGQSPGAQNPMLPRARKAIEWSADHALTASQREQLSRQGVQTTATSTFDKLLATPLGEPFRQTFARRASAVVFGVPVSNRVNIIHASRVLADLCKYAIQDDDFGQVAKSVRSVLTTFTRTIKDINTLLAKLKPAKSDVLFQESDRKVEEIEEVKQVLKEGLEAVLLAYGEYADSVGFTKTEVREAKEALGRGGEMAER